MTERRRSSGEQKNLTTSHTTTAFPSSGLVESTDRRARRRRSTSSPLQEVSSEVNDALISPIPSRETLHRRKSITPTTIRGNVGIQSLGDAHAPSVWITPEWTSHPVIEDFYGYTRRPRDNSFYEVMHSPSNTKPTRTLGENCIGYEDSLMETNESVTRVRKYTKKLGSFSYSTETSDDVTSSPYSTSRVDSDYKRHTRRVHSKDRTNHDTFNGEHDDGYDVGSTIPISSNGYVNWHRKRQEHMDSTEMVPIPNTNNSLMKKHSTILKDISNKTHVENPQGPTSSPINSTRRLRTKLYECLVQIDDRIHLEKRLARDARLRVKKSSTRSNPSPSLVWSLLCGAKTSTSSTSSDGLQALHYHLQVALHHRALNQLQRHRRHINGILQIVTCHQPDLQLTEKQLDSFESPLDMLANDIKYKTLEKQVEMIGASLVKRQEALRQARIKNGRECFESMRVKRIMLSKLLEAVSWYRLVQTNARDESASSSVGLSVEVTGIETMPPSRASSCSSNSRSLQEVQVERILNVLAGEAFYSDYNELMCQSDWWDIAQAHFENVIFSTTEARTCQWIYRVSNDVAISSHEPLEDSEEADIRSNSAEWTKDPQPEQIMEFVERITRRIRKDYEIPIDVSKSLNVFVQRTIFPRLALLCYNQKAIIECQRKDQLWRKRCLELYGIPMEKFNITQELADKIRMNLPFQEVQSGKIYLIRAIEAFNCMKNIIPYDLLEELMYGVVILHHEAALVLGTTQFSVETFFPLLAYVLIHCDLPMIHAQLYLLEQYAITQANVNGEESYYVYCVHAAIEYVCNTTGLTRDE